MLSAEQLQILKDIGQSIAFADDKHGAVNELIVDGYVIKDGDIFELSSKGVTALEEQTSVALQKGEEQGPANPT